MTYPTSNPVFLENTRRFSMIYENDLLSIVQPNLVCRFSNSINFKATVTNNRNIDCDITLYGEESLSLWYSGNQSFLISTNTIFLKRLLSNNASFNPISSQFGFTYVQNSAIVDLNPLALPPKYQGRTRCLINSTYVKTLYPNEDTFNCEVYTEIGGVYDISLSFSYPNAYLVPNTLGIFQDQLIIEMKFDTMNKNSRMQIILNTKELIDRKEMKSDCSDLIVTYDNSIVNRKVTDCNTLSTYVEFKFEDTMVVSSNNYSIFFGNENFNGTNSNIVGAQRSFNYTLKYQNNTLIPLSSNSLNYLTIPKFQISESLPKLSMLGTVPITLTSNITIPDYKNLISFDILDGFNIYPSIVNQNKFSASLNSNTSKVLNLTIKATYKATQENLIISYPSLFYFWNFTTLSHLSPFIDSFNSSNSFATKSIRLFTNEIILSDVELYCVFYHKGSLKYYKAIKESSTILSCLISFNLTLNTEIIEVGLVVNQSSNIIQLHLKNLSYVFLKEPINLLNIPKTINYLNYNSNFTLDFIDLRKSNFVSFSNYSVNMIPELHSSRLLNCSFDEMSPKCMVPLLSFTYVPVKMNMMMSVSSPFFGENIQIQIDSIYHNGI
jgi:hypothetical protein